MSKSSKLMREDPLFMRNSYPGVGKWNIPIVKKQEVNLEDISLISYSDIRGNDTDENRKKVVHFFVDDWRFTGIYNNPQRSLNRLSQYKALLTPDFSTYADMSLWRQVESVAHNRWLGAYWQSKGLLVVPTISWSTPRSYEFCFDGVEKNAVVAVGMIGCKKNKRGFIRGYCEMIDKVEPSAVICFGTPFEEMKGNIISIDYLSSRRVVRKYGR